MYSRFESVILVWPKNSVCKNTREKPFTAKFSLVSLQWMYSTLSYATFGGEEPPNSKQLINEIALFKCTWVNTRAVNMS